MYTRIKILTVSWWSVRLTLLVGISQVDVIGGGQSGCRYWWGVSHVDVIGGGQSG